MLLPAFSQLAVTRSDGVSGHGVLVEISFVRLPIPIEQQRPAILGESLALLFPIRSIRNFANGRARAPF
jgi:hypothetical protein